MLPQGLHITLRERWAQDTDIFSLEQNNVSQRNLGHHKYISTDASILNAHKTVITGKVTLNQISQETRQLQMSKMTLCSPFCTFAIGYAVALFFWQTTKRAVTQSTYLPKQGTALYVNYHPTITETYEAVGGTLKPVFFFHFASLAHQKATQMISRWQTGTTPDTRASYNGTDHTEQTLSQNSEGFWNDSIWCCQT